MRTSLKAALEAFASPASALGGWSSEVALVTAGAAQGSHSAPAASAGDQQGDG